MKLSPFLLDLHLKVKVFAGCHTRDNVASVAAAFATLNVSSDC